MKTLNKGLFIVLVILLVVPLALIAQKKEIPITASSEEAIELFINGREKFENAENEDAEILFDKAIQKDSGFALAHLYRGLSSGSSVVLRENLNKSVVLMFRASQGEKLTILYFQARANGDGEKAKEYLTNLSIMFPHDKRIQLYNAISSFNKNDFSNALIYCKEALKLDKKYAPAYNILGYTCYAMHNFKEAEKAFKAYIKLLPERPKPYDSYAEYLMKTGRYNESIAQYKKALSIDSSCSSSFIGIGNNYIFKGNYAEAQKYYQMSFDKSKNIEQKLNSLYWKGVSYVHEGDIVDALEVFKQYASLAESENLIADVFKAITWQAFIQIESGNPLDGLKSIEEATALTDSKDISESERNNLKVQSLLWKIYGLTACNALNKANDEREKCINAVNARKNSGEKIALNFVLGYFEYHKEEYHKAIDYFSKADNQDPRVWFYTARAWNKLGNKENASRYNNKIITCNTNSLELALYRKNTLAEQKK